MTSPNSSSKLFSDSGQSYDSSRTDSGFLSGANLVSEENLSSEDLFTAGHSSSSLDVKSSKNNSVQLDSGVDICLNEQFSGLTLQQKSLVSDLIESSKNQHLTSFDVPEVNNLYPKSKDVRPAEVVVTQPWECYFHQNEDGDTQLHLAVIQGFIEVVYTLMRVVPHPSFLDLLNDDGQSALHLAVLTRQSKIVRQLVIAGACIETQDKFGNTPLHLACHLGDLECVKSLTEPISVTESTATISQYPRYMQQLPQDFEEKNYEGVTCLHLAAFGSHIDILRHLIWFGANVNARENKSGRTVLHYAVETLNYKLLRFLLDECMLGPNGLKLDTPNYAGHTAYQIARVLDLKIARDLDDRGAHTGVEDLDDEDDDHPDHNALDEEMNEIDIIHSEVGDYQFSREALKV